MKGADANGAFVTIEDMNIKSFICGNRSCIRSTRLSQASSDAIDMPFEITAVDQLGKHELLKGRNGTGIEAELFLKFTYKVLGQDHISHAERGRDCFGKGVHVDHVVVVGQREQSILGL